MYRYEKKESKFKRIIGTIALMIATSAISILLYNMYLKIDILKAPTIQPNDNSAVRLSIEEEEEKEDLNTLEDTTKCVV